MIPLSCMNSILFFNIVVNLMGFYIEIWNYSFSKIAPLLYIEKDTLTFDEIE